MNQEQFINARGEKCPGCGADVGPAALAISNDNGVLHQSMMCSKCGGSWLTQYAASGYSMFKKGKVKKK